MKKMKLILLTMAISLIMFSCEDAGTLKKIDKGNHPDIEVYKYYYDDGAAVYVARFKNSPIVATTWSEQSGKVRITKSNIVIYENDSIQIIKKQ